MTSLVTSVSVYLGDFNKEKYWKPKSGWQFRKGETKKASYNRKKASLDNPYMVIYSKAVSRMNCFWKLVGTQNEKSSNRAMQQFS